MAELLAAPVTVMVASSDEIRADTLLRADATAADEAAAAVEAKAASEAVVLTSAMDVEAVAVPSLVRRES